MIRIANYQEISKLVIFNSDLEKKAQNNYGLQHAHSTAIDFNDYIFLSYPAVVFSLPAAFNLTITSTFIKYQLI